MYSPHSADGAVTIREFEDSLCSTEIATNTSQGTCSGLGNLFFKASCAPLFLEALPNKVSNLGPVTEPFDVVNDKWASLANWQRRAAGMLNFTQAVWDAKEKRDCSADSSYSVPFSRPPWKSLDVHHQNAALFLGFNASTWDQPCPDANATPAPTQAAQGNAGPAVAAAGPGGAPLGSQEGPAAGPSAQSANGKKLVIPVIDAGCGLPVCPNDFNCCQPSLQRCGNLPPCNVLSNPNFIAPVSTCQGTRLGIRC
jgi:hypothetical protein